MSSEKARYAIGEFGTVHKFTGEDVPVGFSPLIEADGATLTEAGLAYCKARRIASPNAEAIRVLCDKYYSSALTEAAVAHDRTLDLMNERLDKTKAMSERLRLDWEAQDKAYKASQSEKK
ncbi:MAG: hypothetical protein MRJ96_06140 [Nitrospirales bacterium]|nr:hypothetical protein [Nitrospira sp.]MDR4501015.1 hypothetical protein [Nitrospirales bacterium]